MKSLPKFLLLLALLAAVRSLEAEETPAFFSFVNAISTDSPTVLKVDGKPIGEPFACGFSTGGLGFLQKNVILEISNGDLPPFRLPVSLSPETSPIVVAYLVSKPSSAPGEPPKKSIAAAAIPCSPAGTRGALRAVLVGMENSTTVTARRGDRGESAAATQIQLIPGKLTPLTGVRSPVQFFAGDTPVGTHDFEGSEPFLLVFYPTPDGKIGFAAATDTVYR